MGAILSLGLIAWRCGIWKTFCIFAVEEINSNLHKSMKTKLLLVTAFILFALGSTNAQVNNNDPDRAYNIGMQYYNQQKYEEAIPWLEIAKKKYKQAHFPLATSYHSLRGEDNHEQAYWNYGLVIGHPECHSRSELFSAFWWLAFFKEDGVGSISSDLKGALFFFEQARQYVDNSNRRNLEDNIARIKKRIADGDTAPRKKVTKDGLLYSGVYTISGEEYDRRLKKYLNKSADKYVNVEIYEDYIIVDNDKCKRYNWEERAGDYKDLMNVFFKDARGKRVYSFVVKGETIADKVIEYYVVDNNYNIYKIRSQPDLHTYDIPMAKGKKEMPRHYK